jgi:phage gp46-like protein
MEEDGVADSVTVTGEIDDEKRILLNMKIQRPDRTEPEKYGLIWDAQEIKRA